MDNFMNGPMEEHEDDVLAISGSIEHIIYYNEENGYKFLPQMYADLIKYAFADDDIIKAYKEIEYIRIA